MGSSHAKVSPDGGKPNGEKIPRRRSRRFSLRTDGVSSGGSAIIFITTLLPSVIAIASLSAMGAGIEVYNLVARKKTDMIGNGLGAIVVFMAFIFFLFDVHKAWRFPKIIAFTVFFALVYLTALLKCMTVPWLICLMILLIGPVALLIMRRGNIFFFTTRRQFYTVVGASNTMVANIVLFSWILWIFLSQLTSSGAQWNSATRDQLIVEFDDVYKNIYKRALNYTFDCGPDLVPNPDAYTASRIAKACDKAESVWFIVWVIPFGAFFVNLLVALFCVMESRSSLTGANDVVQLVRRALSLAVFMLMGMYCALYASGSSAKLASAFMGFFGACILALIAYVSHEVRPEVLATAAQESPFARNMQKAFRSDWVRAVAIGSANVLIPIMLFLDMLRQKMRRCTRRVAPDDVDKSFTKSGQKMVDSMSQWNWNSVFTKVNILAEIAWLLNLGGKMTFILFSWLNATLANVSFGIVIVLVYFVGCTMFLLPPVPGSAVYMFAGIVIGKQAQKETGFWPGVAIACILGLIAKLSACVGQYGIGYIAGQKVQVQKTIGVDTVPTRAIEKVLNRRGFNAGKVAILVGGPDWPTSVTCGILKLDIPQMLLGTTPVFFASIAPQTLVGALLTKDSGSDAAMWAAIKTFSTAVAAVCQAAASLLAMYSITQTIEKDYEELSAYREAHKQVAELTAQQAEHTKAFAHVATWQNMRKRHKVRISIAAAIQLLAGFILATDFALFEPPCFRKFAVNYDINAKYEDNGLEGNPLNIVKLPVGPGVVGLFVVATSLHILHGRDLQKLARARLEADKSVTENGSGPQIDGKG